MNTSTVEKVSVNSVDEVPSSISAVHSGPELSANVQDAEHEIVCAWVPGTTDRIRFTLFRQGQQKVRELAVAKLAAMFGRSVMDDLYLRGRARLRLSERQLLELV